MFVLFADDALLFYFSYHALQAKRVTEIHTSKLTHGTTQFTSKPAIGHNPQPGPTTCHLSRSMSQHTPDALAAELKGSTSSVPKLTSGHDPEPVPSICHLHNLCLQNIN